MENLKQNLIQSLPKIEEILNYTFSDKQLLITAFTHSSFSHAFGGQSNERMEFLGDAVLDFIIAEYLYEHFPEKNEGDYTVVRSDVVDTTSLHREILEKGLINYLLIYGRGLSSDIRSGRNKKIHADLYEAILCAIYLDGGLNEAKRFIFDTLKKELHASMVYEGAKDFKTMLKEAGEKQHMQIEYVLEKREGSDDAPVFYYIAVVDGKEIGAGYGNTIKEAQNYAAKRTLRALNII